MLALEADSCDGPSGSRIGQLFWGQVCFWYSAGVIPVIRLKNFEKNDGLGKFSSSDIWNTSRLRCFSKSGWCVPIPRCCMKGGFRFVYKLPKEWNSVARAENWQWAWWLGIRSRDWLPSMMRTILQWAQWITRINPLRYFVEVMRTIYLRGGGFAELLPQLGALLVFALVFNLWAVKSYRKSS